MRSPEQLSPSPVSALRLCVSSADSVGKAHASFQYIWAFVDADKNDLDGAKTYKLTLPKGIPEARFWSFTLYDNQTRSMLDTPQRYPRAGTELSVTRS